MSIVAKTQKQILKSWKLFKYNKYKKDSELRKCGILTNSVSEI